jgi:hypothetical protein
LAQTVFNMQQDFFLCITDTMVNYWHLKH